MVCAPPTRVKIPLGVAVLPCEFNAKGLPAIEVPLSLITTLPVGVPFPDWPTTSARIWPRIRRKVRRRRELDCRLRLLSVPSRWWCLAQAKLLPRSAALSRLWRMWRLRVMRSYRVRSAGEITGGCCVRHTCEQEAADAQTRARLQRHFTAGSAGASRRGSDRDVEIGCRAMRNREW